MSDQREFIKDPEEHLRSALDDFSANLWVCLPGIVQSYNPQANTCVVQPAIKIRVRQQNQQGDTFQWQNLPLLLDCPVKWPHGGGLLITFPLGQGDEVEIHWADRSINSWFQSGGIQLQDRLRLHDLSDAFVDPGPYSLPNVPPNISTTTAQLRTFAGTAYIELTPGGVVNIVAPGGLNVNGNQVNTGAFQATGEVTAKSGGSAITLSTHVHGGVQAGGADTGGPIG